MSTDIKDLKGGLSNCCGASMYVEQDICCECGEHCGNEEVGCTDCDYTGEISNYYRDESTGFNYIQDGSKPCHCRKQESEINDQDK